MERKTYTLTDADITLRRNVSRRTLLHALGIGAAAAAVATGSRITKAQTQRRDPCRDSDHGPSDRDGCGRPPTS